MTGLAQFSSAITFPAIDPVIFSLGPVQLRWYSLAYIAGIVLGWIYAKRLAGNAAIWPGGKPPFTIADLDDFLFWAVIGIVLGGRLGFVVFYNPAYYLDNPGQILAVWQGGMSFHGGFLGVSIAMIAFCRARGIALWSFVDVIAAVVPIGLFFGRIANFINSELWGRTTDVPWGIVFPNGGALPRHPSQLYEAALEGIVLLLVLRIITHGRAGFFRPRLVTGWFIAGYGAARTFVEFYREPDAQLGYLAGGWLTMGMVLSIPMVIIGVIMITTAKPVSVSHTEPPSDDQ